MPISHHRAHFPAWFSYSVSLSLSVRSFLNFSHRFLFVETSFIPQNSGWGVKIPLPYGNQCLRNHIQELIALSSVNLTGKIEINAMLVSQSIKQHQPLPVLAVRHKSEAINAAEQNVSGLRDIYIYIIVLQVRLSREDSLHRPILDHCIC